MKRIIFFLIILIGIGAKAAQLNPIVWDVKVAENTNERALVQFKATVEPGWHLYGLSLPEDGPNATSIRFDLPESVQLVGSLQSSVAPIEKFDPIFSLKLSWWDSDVTLTQELLITDGAAHDISGTIYFQACNDQTCIAPQKIPFDVVVGTGEKVAADTASTTTSATDDASAENDVTGSNDLWAPVSEFSEGDTSASRIIDSSLWVIFLWGFGGGLLALLTPCVWPLIPMTVSFFLKKSGSRGKSVADAMIYGVSIIVIYLALGLAVTGIFGAGKLNELSTNAWFNIAFFLLLVIFAISFFGGFDITLPSKWSNSVDARAEKATGLISIFFMAFTLALVSFSCTGPIIGTLLVEAASMGSRVGPAVGMGGFAIALALPFTLFAVFPSWLKEMPRSGGWLNSVKVVLGFLELALSLKFLSVADLAYGWGLLDREVFICLWIVIFLLLGLYLLGEIRFSHDAPLDHISIPRFFLSLASLSFALYLLPGLWGAPLKGVSAFVPPLYTQDFSLYEGGEFEEFSDYEEGMAYAEEHDLPVLLDFSGFGCVNCRKMEGAVFDTEVVRSTVENNFVMIKLMVDDKAPLEHPYKVEENGKSVTIETVGEKWSYLQRVKFSANSQPYYIILDPQGHALVPPRFYDENLTAFVEWLDAGKKAYEQAN